MNYPQPHSAGPASRTLSCWHDVEGWVSWDRWKVLQVRTPAPPAGWTLAKYLLEHPPNTSGRDNYGWRSHNRGTFCLRDLNARADEVAALRAEP